MTKKRIRITDGGVALPLGNNTFLMRGRLHSQGGIGIGNGGKNDIEVEDGEVVKFNKDNIQVLSDQPMLNGISPANALLAGGNFNKIFKVQQSINGNNHGSYAKDGLIKQFNDSTSVNYHINDKESVSLKDADNYGYALDWITNWLSKRYSQLNKNERNYDRDDLVFNHDFGLVDVGQYAYDRNMKNILSTPVIIDERYKNLYKDININKTYSYNDFPYIKNIMESNYSYGDKKRNIDDVKNILNYTEFGHFKPFGNHIYLAPYAGESSLIHEFTHTFGYPQKRLISNNKKLKENIEEDYYLDSSNEIYSRLMQFREANNINPEHKYTKEDLQKLKENAKDFNLLNRYTDDTILYLLNDIAKNNNDNKNKNNNVFYAKNGGQINMKLKYKNKQDITDIVMNEILPHSTGKRMKFDMGGKYLLGNIGSNILNGLAQGITGIISGSQTAKFFRNLPDRVSTFVPVARQHISSDVRHILNPQLSEIKRGVSTLIDNAQKNTSSSKNYRQQVANATLKGIEESQKVYNSAAEIQTQRQIANANLQADYDKLDTINKINDIKEQNDYNMQKLIGEQNAKNQIAQSIGDSIGDSTKNIGNSLMDYATMKHDLLKSNQTEDYDEFFEWNNSDMIKNGTLKVPKLTINKLNYKNRITKDYDKFVSIYGKDIVDGWLNQLK